MARKVLAQSKNFTKKDFINSRNGQALQEVAGSKLNIISCAVLHDDGADSDDGEEKTVGTIIAKEGVFTTISPNIVQSLHDIMEIEAEGEKDIMVDIKMRKSKGGRDFLTLTIE